MVLTCSVPFAVISEMLDSFAEPISERAVDEAFFTFVTSVAPADATVLTCLFPSELTEDVCFVPSN